MAGNAPLIVNFAQLEQAFGPGTEGVYAGLAGEAKTVEDQREQAMMEATIQRGLTSLERCQVDPEILSSPDDKVGAVLQSVLARLAGDPAQMRQLATGGLEVRFDSQDWAGWAGHMLMAEIQKMINLGPFHFKPSPLTLDPLPEKARIGILGDFGTGAYGAPFCKASMEADPDGFDFLIHLGDVYYTGEEDEIRERFLAWWPHPKGATSRACNSNHEMYCGGEPYAEITLPAFGQSSSLFGLENEHWMLVGMDTAYDSFDIGDLQQGWLHGLASGLDGRKMILFSHHQLYSKFKAQGTSLQAKLATLLEAGDVFAWYWGHEHLCAVFDQHPVWKMHGRCIGHSGYPYGRVDVAGMPVEKAVGDAAWHRIPADDLSPSALVLDGPNPDIPGKERTFGPNGYAVLELEDEHLTEAIFSAHGEELYRRQLA